jgi:hypothetical protein
MTFVPSLATGAERQPVQVDGGAASACHSADGCACAGNRHVATIPGLVDCNNDVDRPRTGRPPLAPSVAARRMAFVIA